MAAPTVDWQNIFQRVMPNFADPSVFYGTAPPAVPQAQQYSAPDLTPGSDQGYWTQPDYNALLQSDPGWISSQAQISAAEDTAGRQRANAIRQALIQFGAAPSGWQSGYGDVTDADIAAAQQNPFSTMKELDRARSTGSADLAAALGARGMLSSGALTGGEQLLQRNQDLAGAQATNSLLQALGGYEAGYGNAYQGYEAQRQQAMYDAAGRVRSQYLPQWTDTTPAPVAPPQERQITAGDLGRGAGVGPAPPASGPYTDPGVPTTNPYGPVPSSIGAFTMPQNTPGDYMKSVYLAPPKRKVSPAVPSSIGSFVR